MHDKLIGPFFFLEKAVTRRSYLDMQELYALPQLPPHTILQQGGTLPHFCHHVRSNLDREIAGRWIGISEPIAWPLRSPELTPLTFFGGGGDYVKKIIYQVKINDLQHPKACIRDIVAMVTPNMLQATWNGVEYRLDICRATKGAHTEIY
jgi:hypothetical protein